MRPRHKAAENVSDGLYSALQIYSFNEAAA